MYLLVDIGNTNISLLLIRNDKKIKEFKLKANKDNTIDEYYIFIKFFIDSTGYNINDIKCLIISSVIQKILTVFKIMWQKYVSKDIFIIDHNKKLPIVIEIDDPSILGTDIISTSSGSFSKYKNNCIVIDCGTATTISLTDKRGIFRGVSILPGFKYLTLFSSIPDQIRFDFYKNNYINYSDIRILGKNTDESLISGLVYGYCGMIDNIITKIIKKYNLKNYKIILTGGNYCYFKDNTIYNKNMIIELDMIFYGIFHIYKINN